MASRSRENVSRPDRLLGFSQRIRLSATAAARETVRRWDWNRYAILLAAPQRDYLHVRIVLVAVADAGRQVEKVRDKELRKHLAARVQRRPNGGVVIAQNSDGRSRPKRPLRTGQVGTLPPLPRHPGR